MIILVLLKEKYAWVLQCTWEKEYYNKHIVTILLLLIIQSNISLDSFVNIIRLWKATLRTKIGTNPVCYNIYFIKLGQFLHLQMWEKRSPSVTRQKGMCEKFMNTISFEVPALNMEAPLTLTDVQSCPFLRRPYPCHLHFHLPLSTDAGHSQRDLQKFYHGSLTQK